MGTLSDDEMKDLAQRQTTGGPQPGEVWRHYKGGFYVIVARSLQEAQVKGIGVREEISAFGGQSFARPRHESAGQRFPHSPPSIESTASSRVRRRS